MDARFYPFLHDRIKTPTCYHGQNVSTFIPNSEQCIRPCAASTSDRTAIYPVGFTWIKKPSYLIDRYKRYLDWYAKWIGPSAKPAAP
jgi:hypothetical protein